MSFALQAITLMFLLAVTLDKIIYMITKAQKKRQRKIQQKRE